MKKLLFLLTMSIFTTIICKKDINPTSDFVGVWKEQNTAADSYNTIITIVEGPKVVSLQLPGNNIITINNSSLTGYTMYFLDYRLTIINKKICLFETTTSKKKLYKYN
jgi:hypothetical protein